jgi:hypothetical protein
LRTEPPAVSGHSRSSIENGTRQPTRQVRKRQAVSIAFRRYRIATGTTGTRNSPLLAISPQTLSRVPLVPDRACLVPPPAMRNCAPPRPADSARGPRNGSPKGWNPPAPWRRSRAETTADGIPTSRFPERHGVETPASPLGIGSPRKAVANVILPKRSFQNSLIHRHFALDWLRRPEV